MADLGPFRTARILTQSLPDADPREGASSGLANRKPGNAHQHHHRRYSAIPRHPYPHPADRRHFAVHTWHSWRPEAIRLQKPPDFFDPGLARKQLSRERASVRGLSVLDLPYSLLRRPIRTPRYTAPPSTNTPTTPATTPTTSVPTDRVSPPASAAESSSLALNTDSVND